jgi:hypothetical protein
MAIPEFLTDTVKNYATNATAAYSAPIDTSKFAQQVAPQDKAQTDAYTMATQGVGSYSPYLDAAKTAQTAGAGALGQSASTIGGLGSLTGSQAYQPFMSPYQTDVINATLTEYDKSRLGGQQSIRDAAVNSGNFGGGREGAMMGQYNADSLVNRGALHNQMLQQGFGQAQGLAQQNFQNQGSIANAQQGLAGAYGNQMNQQFGMSDFGRQGMGQDINALGSLGSINQGYNQALLSADQQQAQTGAYEPYGRLNQYGNMLTGLSGGMQGQQYQDEQASDPWATALGGMTGVAGLFGQIYGGRKT